MKLTAVLERGLDGSYDVWIEEHDAPFGLLGQGASVKEAIDDFYDGLEDMRDCYADEGEPFPEIEFEFKYDTASFLQYYAHCLSLAGLEKITGINQRQLSHYLNGVRRPCKATVEKIADRIHAFGKEMAEIRLM